MKIVVQVPSYVYIEMPAATLDLLLKCRVFDYNYDDRKFYRNDAGKAFEVRVVEDDALILQPKPVKEEA